MVQKAKAQAEINVVTTGQEERADLWDEWNRQFVIIRANGDQVEASAAVAKKAAMTYREAVQNGIGEFAMIKADRTPAQVDWDEMDFEAVIMKAVNLLKTSQKAYKQCSNEIE